MCAKLRQDYLCQMIDNRPSFDYLTAHWSAKHGKHCVRHLVSHLHTSAQLSRLRFPEILESCLGLAGGCHDNASSNSCLQQLRPKGQCFGILMGGGIAHHSPCVLGGA